MNFRILFVLTLLSLGGALSAHAQRRGIYRDQPPANPERFPACTLPSCPAASPAYRYGYYRPNPGYTLPFAAAGYSYLCVGTTDNVYWIFNQAYPIGSPCTIAGGGYLFPGIFVAQ